MAESERERGPNKKNGGLKINLRKDKRNQKDGRRNGRKKARGCRSLRDRERERERVRDCESAEIPWLLLLPTTISHPRSRTSMDSFRIISELYSKSFSLNVFHFTLQARHTCTVLYGPSEEEKRSKELSERVLL